MSHKNCSLNPNLRKWLSKLKSIKRFKVDNMIERQTMATGLLCVKSQEICRANTSRTRTVSRFLLKNGSTRTSSLIIRASTGHLHQGSMPSKWNRMVHISKTIVILCKLDSRGKELSFLCTAMDARLLITHSWLKCLHKMDTNFVVSTKKDSEKVRALEAELRVHKLL